MGIGLTRGVLLASATLLTGSLLVVPTGAAGQETRVLGLEEAVRTALDRSREVRNADLGLEEANERVSEAWSSVYPSIDFNASYTRNLSPSVNFLPAAIFDPTAGPDDYIAVQFGADNQWQSTISLEQPIFSAGAFLGVGAAGPLPQLAGGGAARTGPDRGDGGPDGVLRIASGPGAGPAHRKLGAAGQAVVGGDQGAQHRRYRVGLRRPSPRSRAGEPGAQPPARRERPSSRPAASSPWELDLPEGSALEVTGALASIDLEDPSANTPENREILAFVGFRDAGDAERAVSLAREMRSDIRQLELTASLRKTEMRLEQVEYLPRISFFGNYIINAQDNGSPNFFARGGRPAGLLQEHRHQREPSALPGLLQGCPDRSASRRAEAGGDGNGVRDGSGGLGGAHAGGSGG